MKRTIYTAAILFLFLLVPKGPSPGLNGEEKDQLQPEWKTPREGVKILKLWESNIGPKWPQIVILKLNQHEYEQFLKNPKDFFNNLGAFGDRPTHRVFRCHLAPLKPGATEYLVIGKHEYGTTTDAMSSNNLQGP